MENGKEKQLAAGELYRVATDVAGVCREIVKKTATTIQDKQYVMVEGWQAIAAAHGFTPSISTVEHTKGGIRAVADLVRHRDGVVIASAEGFVGDDEKTWANRHEYAKRAMAQTRAISRVCRSAFAHVVVLIDEGLSTTPAEEVPEGGYAERPQLPAPARNVMASGPLRKPLERILPKPEDTGKWEEEKPADAEEWWNVPIHFGKNKGIPLGNLNSAQLHWYGEDWLQKRLDDDKREVSRDDNRLIEALLAWRRQKHEPPIAPETLAGRQAREIQDSNEEAAETEQIPF